MCWVTGTEGYVDRTLNGPISTKQTDNYLTEEGFEISGGRAWRTERLSQWQMWEQQVCNHWGRGCWHRDYGWVFERLWNCTPAEGRVENLGEYLCWLSCTGVENSWACCFPLVGPSECGPHLLLLDVEWWRSKVSMETVQTSHKIHWVCLRGQILRPLFFPTPFLYHMMQCAVFYFIAQLDSAFLIAGLSSYSMVPCLHLWKQSSHSCWEVWSLYWGGVYWERMVFRCFGGGCTRQGSPHWIRPS